MTQGKKKGLEFYLAVLNLLRNGSATAAAKKLGLSIQSLSRYLKFLKIHGIIRPIGKGVWQVIDEQLPNLDKVIAERQPKKLNVNILDPLGSNNDRGSRMLSSVQPGTKRTHALQFVVKVPRIKNWNKEGRRAYLKANGIDFISIQQGEVIFIDNCRVWLTNISLVIWLPFSFFVDDVDTGYNYGVYELLRIVQKAETMLKVSFRIKGMHRFRVSRQHHSIVKNSLAKQYEKEKKKLFVFDERGLWLQVDNSWHLHELEGVGNRGEEGKESREDDKHIETVINQFKDTRVTPVQLLEMIEKSFETQKMSFENASRQNESISAYRNDMNQLNLVVGEMSNKLDYLLDYMFSKSHQYHIHHRRGYCS